MNLYVIAAAVILTLATLAGVFHSGMRYERSDWQAKELTRAEKVVVRERVITEKVPVIVTKVVERRVEVEKEVERVITKIPDLVAADCVLPDNFGRLLVLAANGIDPQTARGTDAFTGAYDCRQTITAILADYEAGEINTSRLAGLQDWARLVTKESP